MRRPAQQVLPSLPLLPLLPLLAGGALATKEGGPGANATAGVGSVPGANATAGVGGVPGLCSPNWADCTQSKCCMDSKYQCFEKNEVYAECLLTCKPGFHEWDHGEFRTPWSCRIRNPFGTQGPLRTSDAFAPCHKRPEERGPVQLRSNAMAPKLFCWSVVAPRTYEPPLVATHFNQGGGIFACDKYMVISNVTSEELFEDKKVASRLHVSVIHADMWVKMTYGPVGWDTSSWRDQKPKKHLLNTPVFLRAWQRIFVEEVYKDYDWILKFDVDAFPVPARIKSLLQPHTSYPSKSMYILNTPVDMYGNFLHGPVEVLSQQAVQDFRKGFRLCEREVNYSNIGEDWYLNNCLQHLKVPGVRELRLLEDGYVMGLDQVPCDAPFAVFHPLKSVGAWYWCLEQACSRELDPWAASAFFEAASAPLLAVRSAPAALAALAGLVAAILAGGAGLLLQRGRARAASRGLAMALEEGSAQPCLEAEDTI